MNGEQTRDAMVVALRRDLLGPLADPSGCYPGATPKLIARGQSFGRPSEARMLFVADDGEEVLAADTPTSRYIVGALYPVLLRPEEERELDAAAGRGRRRRSTRRTQRKSRPRPPEKANLGEVESDDDRRARRTGLGGRHHSECHLSSPTRLRRCGCRSVAGGTSNSRMSSTARREPAGTASRSRKPDMSPFRGTRRQAGEAGDSVRAADVRAGRWSLARSLMASGSSPATWSTGPALGRVWPSGCCSLPGSPSPCPRAALAPYPDRDPDCSPEAASLRLLYAAAPVRAVGHGVDAITERTADGDFVATEALPVAEVQATTPNVADHAGPLEVDMDELGRGNRQQQQP